eukprot:TRINITY_DN1644_c0_g1::TRINITY_DN1644_c0_g1_i1::g.17715::m.17715 TRINITY_DN1644_c0_g1::TRINITY_DN1644_c0_g1_i1::g.17715  ORF type:complete len:107 (-),score=5.48,sp/Q8JHF0/PEN2_DANRE/28.74/3e-06,PEN-2/PF10251.4/8.9e-09 TRINITY_DN1644_c0_g1_i1:577-867(-)
MNDQPSRPHPDQERITVARNMFYGTLAFLPWLGICSVLYHWDYLKTTSCNPTVKSYVYKTAFITAIYTTAFVIWQILYHTKRKEWENGEEISVVWT